MPPVPPDALRDVPEPVTACPNCASLAIRPATAGEGGVAGSGDLLEFYACPSCGHRGPAITFAKRADYVDFAAGFEK